MPHRSRPRSRHDVPHIVVRLLWPVYRRSEVRTAREQSPIYVLRVIGDRWGPVLRAKVSKIRGLGEQ